MTKIGRMLMTVSYFEMMKVTMVPMTKMLIARMSMTKIGRKKVSYFESSRLPRILPGTRSAPSHTHRFLIMIMMIMMMIMMMVEGLKWAFKGSKTEILTSKKRLKDGNGDFILRGLFSRNWGNF